jgi:hypothetical protein
MVVLLEKKRIPTGDQTKIVIPPNTLLNLIATDKRISKFLRLWRAWLFFFYFMQDFLKGGFINEEILF